MVKYPEVKVELVGQDGNAFAILGKISREMRRAGLPEEEIKVFQDEATSGDYDHLLQTCMKWVTCDECDNYEEEEDDDYDVYRDDDD